LAAEVKIVRGNRQGVNTIEVTIGHYPTAYEIAEKWRLVKITMDALRDKDFIVTETKHNNLFKSYSVEAPPRWKNL
jgi:hypothetical protein